MTAPETRSRTVTWEDPLAVLAAAKGMSGLEYIRAIGEGKMPPPPIAVTMGFHGTETGEGRAVFVGEPGEFLYNPIGVVHGGFAMTLLDSAMGVAVHTTLAQGERYTTLETKVNFVRPITTQTGRVPVRGRCHPPRGPRRNRGGEAVRGGDRQAAGARHHHLPADSEMTS